MNRSISELIISALGPDVEVVHQGCVWPHAQDYQISGSIAANAELGNTVMQQVIINDVVDYYNRWNKPSKIILGHHATADIMVVAPG